MTAIADAQARLRECERQHSQLMALHAISEALNRSLDLDSLLQVALERVLEVLQLDAGDVRLVQDGCLTLRAARAVSSDFLAAERTVPLGFCQCGRAALCGEVLVAEEPGQLPSASSACASERFAAVLSVPIQTTERVVGLIHVASRTPRTFDAADRELLAAIGHQIGAAIEQARLHKELKALNATLETRVAERTRELEAAREALAQKAEALREMRVEERRIEEKTRGRIAHDLHDSVQQLIIGALFEIQAARELLASQPELAAARLADAQGLLRRIEAEMRRAIFSLRPVMLDAHGLAPAVRELAAEFARASGVRCEVRVAGKPRRFAADAEVAAFRIVQEALNNLAIHARASSAEVGVHFGLQHVIVEIRDDGVGFDLAAIEQQPRAHLGLMGMRERAESVGGALAIWSRPGEGTRVTLRLPLAQDKFAEAL
ncbi:MAG: GAF domain-containing sensor histidine kinase [Anaerolineae bacterium]